MTDRIEIDDKLVEMLAPALPTAVTNGRLELGLSLRHGEPSKLTVVRTVAVYHQDVTPNRTRTKWVKVEPIFADESWAKTLGSLGEVFDQLYDRQFDK